MATKVLNGLDLQSTRIQNVGSPMAGTDAVNRNYVDSRLAGLHWKQSVRAASTDNVDISQLNAGDDLDSVTLAEGDRVLLKNQTDKAENGIYVIGASAGQTARAEDCDSAAEMQNATVFVSEGSANADKAFTQTADDVDVDTDDNEWVQFGGAGGEGGSYTADGQGVEIDGSNVISLELDGTSLSKSGSGLRIADAAAGSGLSSSSGVLSVNTGTASATGLEIDSDVVRIATAAAGNGLTGGGGSALAVNTGTASATGLEISSDTVRISSQAAGNGLTGGGGSALAVGQGTGIVVNSNDVAVDTTVVALQSQKYSADVGAGTSVTVTHNLGTRDVIVQVFTKGSPYDTVLCDVERTTENSVTLKFASAVSSGEYRVVIHG